MKLLKEIKWVTVLRGLLYILMGVVSFLIAESMVQIMGYVLGIVLILAGAVSMISYAMRDPYQNYYHDDFLYGIVGVAIGCIVLYRVDLITSMVPFLLACMVVFSGASKLQDVIDMKRLECGGWIFTLLLAVINLILGAVLMINPFKDQLLMFQVLGGSLVFSGALDSILTVYFAGKLHVHQRREEKKEAEINAMKESLKAAGQASAERQELPAQEVVPESTAEPEYTAVPENTESDLKDEWDPEEF